ncbi:MAG: carboxypeptidase-like regulatory domain-containing protein, partial [Tannerella sp.]|nr:carboxypeptidase-like regulatory domain-containing protein [Tannerella sp.]
MMNTRKLFLGFLLWFIPFILSGQRYISGRITDAADSVPIPNAAVFIANTTVGTTTDVAGNYRLEIPGEGNYQLAVSHVGYLPVFGEIEAGKASKVLDVALQIREMEEVEVAVKVKVRKNDVDLFWKTILGKKPSKKTIYAANSEEVYYYYNSQTRKLTVSCRVPLQIVNYETGYRIQYVLNYFTHDYKTNSSSWEGQYMFSELEPENIRQQQHWEENREKVYQVSITNFIKSLYQNSLPENGFLLGHADMKPVVSISKSRSTDIILTWTLSDFNLANPDSFLLTDPIGHDKTFHVPHHPITGLADRNKTSLMLICFGRPITEKELHKIKVAQKKGKGWDEIGLFQNTLSTPEPIHIYPDGTYRNPLQLSPEFSSKPLNGLNMMLPAEYQLNVESVNAFAKDGQAGDVPANTGLQAHPLADTLIRAVKRFDMQLNVFPQEKVYLHTDKPYYISGERIW